MITQKIRVPAGSCPIKMGHLWILESCPSEPIICSWMMLVLKYGERKGETYTAEALVYWAGTEFNDLGNDFKYIEQVIEEYYTFIHS